MSRRDLLDLPAGRKLLSAVRGLNFNTPNSHRLSEQARRCYQQQCCVREVRAGTVQGKNEWNEKISSRLHERKQTQYGIVSHN